MGGGRAEEGAATVLHTFTRAVLNDLQALEQMLSEGRFEPGRHRIGAEQEYFLIDAVGRAAPAALSVLSRLGRKPDHNYTTELGLFNLEANLPVYDFTGDCLSRLERDLHRHTQRAREAAELEDAELALAGILPSLRKSDLTLAQMTPNPRYQALNDALLQRSGGRLRVHIKGTDELEVEHDNIMLEACNTSFQVHFQVPAEDFVRAYNLAQALTAPVLACAVNAPLLLGKRLWHETRVALFQHSIDDRGDVQRARGKRPRVRFGDGWLRGSVTQLFREDIARFRPLLAPHTEEDALAVLAQGQIPQLEALRLYNGTIYRWNRPCYGVHNGVPTLRIECRALPAGPSVLDEVANAAFFYGLMCSVNTRYGDISEHLSFDDAYDNFLSAARQGLQAQLQWVGGPRPAQALILEELLPLAREGLRSQGIDEADIERYLGVVQARVEAQRTGASWMLDSLAKMPPLLNLDTRLRTLTRQMVRHQRSGQPVHTWPLAQCDEALADWLPSYTHVAQFMTEDVHTVRPDDLVDLAANLMEWMQVRHIPVEDDSGRLVGLLTHRLLLRALALGQSQQGCVAVRDVMQTDPPTVGPHTSTVELLRLMRRHQLRCLPVVEADGRLLGIVTDTDVFRPASLLMEQALLEEARP